MSELNLLVQCYNKGCGKNFDPEKNNEDDCQHHPGVPVFHDAYKGWSCCKKKCTDFTEFLNIPGCTKSKHSNLKPPEPPKPIDNKSEADKVIEVGVKPIISEIKRPDFDSMQTIMKPTVSATLTEQLKGITCTEKNNADKNVVVKIGQTCVNNSCKKTYQGPDSNSEVCKHHPGAPIFHEGMKYWSCCQKKTSDFSTFLDQQGCTEGNHIWFQKGYFNKKAKCRMDWHQTGTHVYVSVFAKKYNPDASFVKLNPIHLTVELYFPEEDSNYNLDIELRGVVDVEASSVSMLPTKVEIKLRKKEPGTWSKLNIPRENESTKHDEVVEKNNEEDNLCKIETVDLNDL